MRVDASTYVVLQVSLDGGHASYFSFLDYSTITHSIYYHKSTIFTLFTEETTNIQQYNIYICFYLPLFISYTHITSYIFLLTRPNYPSFIPPTPRLLSASYPPLSDAPVTLLLHL
jgi:hypothetical protein